MIQVTYQRALHCSNRERERGGCNILELTSLVPTNATINEFPPPLSANKSTNNKFLLNPKTNVWFVKTICKDQVGSVHIRDYVQFSFLQLLSRQPELESTFAIFLLNNMVTAFYFLIKYDGILRSTWIAPQLCSPAAEKTKEKSTIS